MNNIFLETIPFWRRFISKTCNIELKNIIASKSYYKSDMSLISDNGLSLDGRTVEKEIILFDLEIAKGHFTQDTTEDKHSTIYECKLDVDIYGDDIHEKGLVLYTSLLSSESVLELKKNHIGVNPQIEFSSSDEEINGVMWSRFHIEINFQYEHIMSIKDSKIENIDQINIKKGK